MGSRQGEEGQAQRSGPEGEVTPVEYYDRSDWQLCVESGCPNLFTDGCQGPGICAKAVTRAQGIQIYVTLPGQRAQYVTTKTKKH